MIFKLGNDIVIGDVIYGRRVNALRAYRVPARILHVSVTAKHPEGLPAWLADLGPSATQCANGNGETNGNAPERKLGRVFAVVLDPLDF